RPARLHAHANAHLLARTARVDHVQQGHVAAVELDQRKRERMLEWLLRAGLGDPGPGGDHSLIAHLHELAERLTRVGIVLAGRHEHAALGRAYAEDAPVTQTLEERTQNRAQAALEGVLQRERSS